MPFFLILKSSRVNWHVCFVCTSSSLFALFLRSTTSPSYVSKHTFFCDAVRLPFCSKHFVMHLALTCVIQDIDIRLRHQIRSNCRRQHFENFVYRVLPHEIIHVRNLPKVNLILLTILAVQIVRRMSENRMNDSNFYQGRTRLPCTAVTIQEKTMLITSMSNKHLQLLSLRKKRNPRKFLSEILKLNRHPSNLSVNLY
jgi:hypothetical protein